MAYEGFDTLTSSQGWRPADMPADSPPAGEDDEVPGQSWLPVDLGSILRGEHVRPEPIIGMARRDGIRLLYPGKEHAVIGEMESGKSWVALACCVAELMTANHVLYVHFEEADATDTVERLRALGVPPDVLLELFRFVGPEERVTAEWLAALLTPAPSLVVLDGVNEAMSLHGWGIREEDGAATYRRRLVKPCTRAGAAVLSCDHVVKDKERRDRSALGSVHKGNGLSGSLILLENAEPFGRGQRGRSHVFVTKDRPGSLRRHGQPTKTPGKTYMGELVVDDTRTYRDGLDLTFFAPADKSESGSGEPVDPHVVADNAVLDVVRAVIETGRPASVRSVRARSRLGTDPTRDALERLVQAGRLVETTGPRNARYFHLPGGP